MTKVCMVVMNNFSPDVRISKEAKTLASAGHQVLVLAMKKPEAAEYVEMQGFVVKRIDLKTRPWPKWFPVQIIKYLEFAIRVLQEINRFQADVVHVHDFPALPIGWLSTRITKAKLVYDSHEFWLGLDSRLYASRFGQWFIKLIEGTLARRADVVITINQIISEQLSKIYDIPNPDIIMNAQPLSIPPRVDKLRPAIGVDPNTRIAIYAASLRSHRGLEELVQSTKYLTEDILLVLMGPDRMEGKLHKYVEQLGLQSQVRIMPPVPQDEVASYVAFADLGIITSQSNCLNRYYGLGNKIFHYIAAGVPIAVSNQPERKRIVEEYGLGVVFDETNPKDIAEKIQSLVRKPQLCQQMRQHARAAHTKELNWEHEGEKLLQIYRGLEEKK